MAFYKRENEQLTVAPNFVHAPGYSLLAEKHNEHTYPVDGWCWFDTLDAALKHFASEINGSALTCTRRQGRRALLAKGLLLAVEDAIAAIVDPAEKMAAEIDYEADTWSMEDPFLQKMWQRIGGTTQELEDLFKLAITL